MLDVCYYKYKDFYFFNTHHPNLPLSCGSIAPSACAATGISRSREFVPRHTSSVPQVFQLYQAQIAQLKAAVGQQPPQASAAYRVPDTDFALSATRANDRTTLSLGCVPDDSAPLLGPQGFVCGVTPLNLGLTLNLHV